MAEISLSLAGLFEDVFGYKTSAFEPEFAKVAGDLVGQRNERGAAAGSPYYANDFFGREVFLPITLMIPSNGVVVNDLAAGQVGKLKEWTLYHSVVGIDCQKTIVKTPLTERRGEVVELININSYNISIKGFLIAMSNDFPEDLVQNLKFAFETQQSLDLKCALTDIFLGTDKVVITNMVLPEVREVKNVRAFDLKLISDSIFNLFDLS